MQLEEARLLDPDYQIGDVLEVPVDFAEFGRAAVQAAKQRIVQRVREGERSKIKDEFTSRVGDLLSGEIQQIERGKIVVMLNKFREAEAIMPYRDPLQFMIDEPVFDVLKEAMREDVERAEDIPQLADFFLQRYNTRFRKTVHGITDPTMALLRRYWWPGNIRELENLIERLVAVMGSRPAEFVRTLPCTLTCSLPLGPSSLQCS